MTESTFDLRKGFEFKHPTTILISGPTGSGKTRFLVQCLKESLIYPFPTRIIWVYGEWQTLYDEVKNLWPWVEFVKDMATQLYESLKPTVHNLVVVDDMMNEAGGSDSLANLFTKGSHHRNLTVVFIVQNLFHQAKSMRTVSLNSHYMVLFKNPRDIGQIRTLASQMFPTHPKFLTSAFADATSEKYGYIVLDLHPDTPEELRVRSHIFSNDIPVVYQPPGDYKKGQ